jgi:hypothetical protein
MSQETNSKGLHGAYQRAGKGFLALKLSRLFTKIESDEDRVLHNDTLADVLSMVKDGTGQQEVLNGLAELILLVGQKRNVQG